MGKPARSGEAASDVSDEARREAAGTGLVVKALNLIDLIAAEPGRHKAQSLADELGLPRSTVYRIIATLQQRGLVRSDGSGQGYYPGFRFLDYAQAVWPVPDLPMLAMAEMRRLRELTGETVYFGVPGGGEMIIIQKAEGRFAVRSAAPLGSRRPLHCTGMGKAWISAVAATEREALLGRLSLERITERTITDPAQLRSQLDLYRLRGYAIDDEEFMEGVRCVSAPVPGEAEASLGALTVSGPVYRMTPERAHQLGPEVAAAARRLGESVRRQAVARPRSRPGGAPVPVVADAPAFLGRAPLWSSAGRLLWLDSLAPALMAAVAAAGHPGPADILARFASPALALAEVAGMGLVVVTASGAVTVSPGGGVDPLGWPLPHEAASLVTTAVADGSGGLWVGLGEGAGPGGPGLARLTASGLDRVADLGAAPTDLVLDRSGRTLYAALSDAGEIVRFDLDEAGRPGPPRSLTRVDAIHGRPAALALEGDGHLWVALWDGWSIARLTLAGDDMRLLPLPVPRPTGLVFGGADGDVLYVTSARSGLAPQQIAEAPASGSLFALDRSLRQALLR